MDLVVSSSRRHSAALCTLPRNLRAWTVSTSSSMFKARQQSFDRMAKVMVGSMANKTQGHAKLLPRIP